MVKVFNLTGGIMDHHVRMGYLLTFYEAILTDRQREMMRLAFEEDWSLSEIAEAYGVSRQAVHDALHRSETAMEELESSLHLLDRIVGVEGKLEAALTLAQGQEDLTRLLSEALDQLKGEDAHGL